MIEIEVQGKRFVIASGEFNARQSAIKSYNTCHRLYGWERVEGLAPERPDFKLEFGSATHTYLQERGRGAPSAVAMSDGLKRLTRDFPKPLFPGEDQEMFEHTELAKTLWPLYDVYWAQDQFIPLGQEVKGRVEVGQNTGVFLVFQLDRLVSWLDNLWLVDYKTMSKNDDRNFQRFEWDLQPTAYVYGASKVLGKRVAGIIIDGLIKTKVPQFRREQYLRTDEELLEFEDEFVENCYDIASRHARVEAGENWKTVFYKNTGACLHLYGRICPFRTLCTKDTPMLRMQYKSRTQDYMDDPKLLNAAAKPVPEGD